MNEEYDYSELARGSVMAPVESTQTGGERAYRPDTARTKCMSCGYSRWVHHFGLRWINSFKRHYFKSPLAWKKDAKSGALSLRY